jgi:adenine-specific DNA-methyltransferase
LIKIMATKQPKAPKPALIVETLNHDDATRKNIPTAEYQSVMAKDEQKPVRVEYERRNKDLDPQLVWRGKDEQDWSNLIVQAPPLYIQEKVHPKVLIDDLKRQSEKTAEAAAQVDLFADFNGLPNADAKTEFYQHDGHWANRMILGDSLSVMASLAEREGLRGKVQCIYFDPPYGIKFNSNFQWSTTSRDVKDGNAEHITREPEQVKAFRDTWRDGIHSYLTYLRDRLTVARDLLTDSGSIFVQIGDENVHRVRAVMDEVFGDENSGPIILVKKKGSQKGGSIESINDYLLVHHKNAQVAKYRQLYEGFQDESEISRDFAQTRGAGRSDCSLAQLAKQDNVGTLYKVRPLLIQEKHSGRKLFTSENITAGGYRTNQSHLFEYEGQRFDPGLAKGNCWKHTAVTSLDERSGMHRLAMADRLYIGEKQVRYVRYFDDFGLQPISNWWDRFGGAHDPKYVVQTSEGVVERCILMATDPGDLVLDPTCGSGTTAFVAEQWARRWITIDTSRVALALARARIMGARYPFYLLADSRDGQTKEAEVTRTAPSSQTVRGNIRQGFVYQRVPHITSALIANNSEIDVIWDRWQVKMEILRQKLNFALKNTWQEWEILRDADANWPSAVVKLHTDWWQARNSRQYEIDKSIAAKAAFEYLYDKPYDDKKKVRVAGPFTVESLSPHRVLGVDADDELIDPNNRKSAERDAEYTAERNFVQIILENLKSAGVQQAHKDNKIDFTSLVPWPGDLVCADGRYMEGTEEKRAAVFIGPEFGTVSRPDLVAAAREAGDSGFDVLIACAFNYDAHSSEFDKLGRIPVLKARMNADLHMAEDLKNTGKGNLFVIFGEPDIDILDAEGDQVRVKVNGVDVFHPNTGKVQSDGADGIACWFIDTDYNEESFFVRHAYFLGANDPYKALKTTLKAEINEEAWATLNSDTSRSFDKPKSGRIAVKVINHLGDEVMKVFKVV